MKGGTTDQPKEPTVVIEDRGDRPRKSSTLRPPKSRRPVPELALDFPRQIPLDDSGLYPIESLAR